MKTMNVKSALQGILLLLVIGFSTTAFAPDYGLDSYEIHLNEKLIMKQFVNQPLNLRTLQLEKAEAQDMLWVKYTHCTLKGAGSNRAIVLKDDQGHELTQWTFADSRDENKAMKISVAELRKFEEAHKNHQVSLYYKSSELPGAELLAYLK
ncbi:hypothetical protein [Algoriphagus vanfongensis]|uniref:hypothetical protein n=1 Tax=Algoriphagus vanfongensis TaxID=426371 RepID=UPI00041C2AFF|nr:hypothetical protein [Algoriphagus vanfongensis]